MLWLGEPFSTIIAGLVLLMVMFLSCDQQTQDATGRLTFADLITTKQGRDVARALLNAVINQQLSYQIGVST
jgi:hypothetical protein